MENYCERQQGQGDACSTSPSVSISPAPIFCQKQPDSPIFHKMSYKRNFAVSWFTPGLPSLSPSHVDAAEVPLMYRLRVEMGAVIGPLLHVVRYCWLSSDILQSGKQARNHLDPSSTETELLRTHGQKALGLPPPIHSVMTSPCFPGSGALGYQLAQEKGKCSACA